MEKILIVDDEAMILEIAGRVLRKEGYEVETANCGEDALKVMEKGSFDFLLTDVQMPGMGGMALLKLFKKRMPNTAAVIITGHGTIEMAMEAIGIGANGFIMKPFTQEELLCAVSTAFETTRLIKENVRLRSLLPLFEVSGKLMDKLDPDVLLNYVADISMRETGADSVSIMLRKEDGSLVMKAEECPEKGPERGHLIKICEKIAGKVIQGRLPLLVREDDEGGEYTGEIIKENISSAMFIPLKVEDEVMGTVNVVKQKGNLPLFATGDVDFMGVLASQTAVALKNTKLVEELKDLFLSSISSLSMAIDAKSTWTAGHSGRVTDYALEIGREMGLSEKDLESLNLAGILHDVGKIGTYEHILDKPGKLTDEEYEMVKKHPAKGAAVLEPIKQLKDVIPAIRHHHENYDGTGYPDGLKGEDIPLAGRILAVADTFDAMKADRPYRKGRTMEFIREEFKRCSGIQFDPKVVEAFRKTLDKSG